jgi:tryptophanase
MRAPMEPYRIKVVEPLTFRSRAERRAALERGGWNLFNLRAEDITIDLLTDSGTAAMSARQWAALVDADETYAGSRSYERFAEVVSDLTGYQHIFPVHQGRAAERILFSALLRPGQLSLSNTHFDTTRANIELCGAEARDLPCAEATDLRDDYPFKGNMNLPALEAAFKGPDGDRVTVVVMTITNNAGGGQPVSMANLRAVSRLCRARGVRLVLDGARFAENAWLVTQRERGYQHRSPREVAEMAFRLSDGCVASLKKDGIANIGGLLAVNDGELASRCQVMLIATEGFPTYGGLSGRDLEALAIGLREVTDPAYLAARSGATAYLAEALEAAGLATVRPPGCHAVYVDAGALLPHLPARRYPAHALACELYLEGGIRGVELGTLTFGRPGPDGLDEPAPHELLRLALPRRVYTGGHLDYVAEVAAKVVKRARGIPGYRVVDGPSLLRHFTARLAPVNADEPANTRVRS